MKKFTESYNDMLSEAGTRYLFTANDFMKIDSEVKKLKPADVDKIATKYGLKQPAGTTTAVFGDKIKYSSDGMNIDAYFNIEYDYDDGPTKAGVVITFSIKKQDVVGFNYGGGGAWTF
jgi:hypothetical protein